MHTVCGSTAGDRKCCTALIVWTPCVNVPVLSNSTVVTCKRGQQCGTQKMGLWSCTPCSDCKAL